MTDEFNRRQYEVMQREIAEAEANKYQLMLDRWVQSRRDAWAEEQRVRRELDPCLY